MIYTNVASTGNTILFRGYDDTGKRIHNQIKYQPFLFVPTDQANSKYRTLFGKPLKRIDFKSLWDARQFAKQTGQVVNSRVYGSTNFPYVWLYEKFREADLKADMSTIRVGIVDIEVMSDEGMPDPQLANQEVVAITIRVGDNVYALGCGEFTPKDDTVSYTKCLNEGDLLERFIELWRDLDIDVVTGWNIQQFDIPYIINRIRRVLSPEDALRLSPWNRIDERSVTIFNKTITLFTIVGIADLDYLQLYKKFARHQQESYKLDFIAYIELSMQKVDYSHYETLHQLYNRDFSLFMEYNIHDVTLVHRLDRKLRMIEQAISIAYDAKVNFVDMFTSVKMWDTIIHNFLLDQNVIIPPQKHALKERQNVGAFVKPPLVGMHSWVVSFDLTSLYPRLIEQYNISPETLKSQVGDITVDKLLDGIDEQTREQLTKQNVALAASGCVFDKDFHGAFPQLMARMFNDRAQYKRKMLELQKQVEVETDQKKKRMLQIESERYDHLQYAKKIQLNSLYGALSNEYFRWFDLRLAESITLSGQLSIRWAARAINQLINKLCNTTDVDYIIAIDTDSLYITLEGVVKQTNILKDKTTEEIIEWVERFCVRVIQPYLEKTYSELAEHCNAYANKMDMKREVIANKGIWVAKKRYVLDVYSSEGVMYKEPKLKIMGLDAVRSTISMTCREKIKETLKLALTTDEQTVQRFVKQFKDEFQTLPFDDVMIPKGCNGLSKYYDPVSIYTKGTPIHVKGALLYNNLLKTRGLEKRFPLVLEGEKIKYAYLKNPNPLQDTVISVPSVVPKELELDQYIDRTKQFNKLFLEPVDNILKKIGWSAVYRRTLRQILEAED